MSEEQKRSLLHLINSPTTAQRMVPRARIVPLRAKGLNAKPDRRRAEGKQADGGALGRTVFNGRIGRFGRSARERAKAFDPRDQEGKVIVQATQPPPNKTRWSVRTMAREVGMSPATVQRIWAANEIKPHLIQTFKLSTDPQFEAKFWDVIGLYLSPPNKALVLCCNEKSQCQALERTQPGLPLGIGHIRTATHDYVRHGTVTLFVALNYLDGRIMSTTAERHTHVEWLTFLKKIHRQTPPELAPHLIVNNCATHKYPHVLAWIKQHPRINVHFTPTGSSWMNLVQRFFRQLTDDVVREGQLHQRWRTGYQHQCSPCPS